MNDRELFKELNGINYNEEEIKEYINFSNIEDKKLSSITNDVKTNLAKEKLKEACIYVEERLLEKDEVIEKISGDLKLSKDLIYKRLSRGRDKIRKELIKG